MDRLAPPSPMTRDGLRTAAAFLAVQEVNRGNKRQAEDAFAAQAKFGEYLVSQEPAGSYAKALQSLLSDVTRLNVAQAEGDDRLATDVGRAVTPKLEQLQPTDEVQRRTKNLMLRVTRWPLAQSAYALKDYATAEREMAQVLELRQRQPYPELGDRREIAYEQAFAALVLARLNRLAEAQQRIAPVLKFERELYARNRDNPAQRWELAVALYVASVAGLGDAGAQLAEANALMDKLPSEMRALRDVALWRERIVEERARRRP